MLSGGYLTRSANPRKRETAGGAFCFRKGNMNKLILAGSPQTMTTKEIAELTGKRHDNVVRDFVTQCEMLGVGILSFEDTYVHPQNGVTYTIYRLPHDEAVCLVSGYDVKARMAVIKRWQELESKDSKGFDLSDANSLRMALLNYSEKVIALEEKIETDAPKVRFAETIRAIDGVCYIQDIAKTLGFGRNKFFSRLREDKILIKGTNLPYQKYIDRGYFTVFEGMPYTDNDGVKHPVFTTQVTGAGQVFLAKRYSNIEGIV